MLRRLPPATTRPTTSAVTTRPRGCSTSGDPDDGRSCLEAVPILVSSRKMEKRDMKLTRKTPKTGVTTGRDGAASERFGLLGAAIDRRTFLKRSGLGAGAAALAGSLPLTMMRRAEAQDAAVPEGNDAPVEVKRTVCSHCSVGCGSIAYVKNGVWVGQEPDFESPINLGAHCAKGAALREHGIGERRVKYPMKLENGSWKRISWEQAVNEIGDKMLKIREEHGPDAVFFCGSSK